MQFINRYVEGRQEIGHIDLLQKFSYIEVPEQDAEKVMDALNGTTYKGREVRCNDADEKGHGTAARGGRSRAEGNSRSDSRSESRDSRKGESRRGESRKADAPSTRKGSKKENGKAAGTQRGGYNFDAFDKRSKRDNDASSNSRRGRRGAARMESGRPDDWRQFFQGNDIILRGEEPDFSEEGWARRRPKKK